MGAIKRERKAGMVGEPFYNIHMSSVSIEVQNRMQMSQGNRTLLCLNSDNKVNYTLYGIQSLRHNGSPSGG